MNSHIAALTQTLIIYALLSVSYFGWGMAAAQLLGIGDQTSMMRRKLESTLVQPTPDTQIFALSTPQTTRDFDITTIWLGWAFTLSLFQLLHFFFPLTAYVVCPIFAIGLILAIPQIIKIFQHFHPKKLDLIKIIGLTIIVTIIIAWIASRAMLAPTHYDSGLYHFSAIRWINSFPTVLGLGNLHGRLAFNQSFFTYVATLNFYPFFGYGRSIANSFLLILTIATFGSWLRPICKQPSLLLVAHPFQYAAILVAFPYLGYLALSPTNLASPSPDLTSTLLQLTLFMMFVRCVAEWTQGEAPNTYRIIVLNILAVTAITIKLSNLAFAAVIIGFSIAYILQRSRSSRQDLMRIILPNVLIMLIWAIRGYILSGAPLYPATIGYISAFDWAIPIESIKSEANWIYSWARQPRVHWQKVLANWDWFAPWLQRISQEFEIVYPLYLSMALGIFTALIHLFSRRKQAGSTLNWAITTPVVFGLIYWFVTAPDPRFANALFSCLSLSTTFLLLAAVQPLLNKYAFIPVLCGCAIAANIHIMGYIVHHQQDIHTISTAGWYPVKTVPLLQKTTQSGLVVSIPAHDDRSWDAPLPAAPIFDPSLRLRVPGQLGAGFTVKNPAPK